MNFMDKTFLKNRIIARKLVKIVVSDKRAISGKILQDAPLTVHGHMLRTSPGVSGIGRRR